MKCWARLRPRMGGGGNRGQRRTGKAHDLESMCSSETMSWVAMGGWAGLTGLCCCWSELKILDKVVVIVT